MIIDRTQRITRGASNETPLLNKKIVAFLDELGEMKVRSFAQIRSLLTIGQKGSASMGFLAVECGISKGATTGAIDSLEREDVALVERHRLLNNRTVTVLATAKGEALLRKHNLWHVK